MADYQHRHPEGAGDQTALGGLGLKGVVHLAGSLSSLALIVGVGVWGYQMAMRDVSGVPVVRAAEGPMRVQPEDPGGTQALHQGLAVNAVVAEGEAERPADRIILAPEPLDLALEDRVPAVARSTSNDQLGDTRVAALQALADQLSEGVSPIGESPGVPAADTAVATALEDAQRATPTPTVDGGIGRSLRPKARPQALLASLQVDDPQLTATEAGVREIDPETIPLGTRLAQLGAFGSREIAVSEWEKLTENFGEYLDGKARVIQRAQSGGRTFYRLRAMGFDDLSEARRFCSVLVAEKAECIPVVTR